MRKTIGWGAALGLLMVLACAAWAQTCNDKPQAKAEKDPRREAIKQAMAAKDYDKALTLLEELGGDKNAKPEEKFISLYYRFDIQAKQKHDGVKAGAVAKQLAELVSGCHMTLNYLAWTILDTPGLENRDLDLALQFAQKAAEITKHEDCTILDTLARAYYEKGDLDKAVEVQTMAVEKSELKKTLEKYKAKKNAAK
jgi:ATP/maltotriose-dependent transcriptional regulator MalT